LANGSPRLWRAPAKVNLTLHVLGRRTDGWHELDSVVAFAGCCDGLAFEPAETLSLTIDGPTASAAGPTDDNLVLRAARALAERVPRLRLGRFHLLKALPVAAGLGGGSSDAAAALRALAAANGLAPDDDRLFAAAAAVGADVPVCLDPRARHMAGRGERLGPALRLPPLPAVLANPGAAVATPAVFAALGLEPGASLDAPPAPRLEAGSDAARALEALKAGRNDLQASATRLAPAIGDTLDALARLDGARLVRMSGSGATCFALFDDRHAAARAARALARAHPGWWVRATYLR
jgi:4-diphosphocytidyl-2-C-methyl-D-erythritol kinase